MSAPKNNKSPDRTIDTVIFDLDDTLIDWSNQEIDWQTFTRPMVDNIYDYLLKEGHDLPDRDAFNAAITEEIRDGWEEAKKTWSGLFFERMLHRAFLRCALDADSIDVETTMKVYDWQPVPGVVPFPDALAVLRKLQKEEYKLGLLTNSMFPMWMRDVELEAYGMLPFFLARTSAGDTGDLKPNPAIYLHLLDMLDASPETTLFVGDRPENDIAGANAAGLTSVLIKPPHLDRPLNDIAPDYTITTLSELLPIIEKLNQPPAKEKNGAKQENAPADAAKEKTSMKEKEDHKEPASPTAEKPAEDGGNEAKTSTSTTKDQAGKVQEKEKEAEKETT